MTQQTVGARRLNPNHEQILAKAGISREQAESWGIFSCSTDDGLVGTDLDHQGNHGKTGLVFPLRRIDGSTTYQMRVDNHLVDEDAGVRKYAQAAGVGSIINVPAVMAERVGVAAKVLVVEGTKQTIAASLYAPEDVLVVGIQGIQNWTADGAPVQDLARAVKGAEVAIIVPDADFATNAAVYDATANLRDVLDGYGLDARVARVPGTRKTGLDDFLGSNPDPTSRPAMLARLIEKAKPSMGRRPAASRGKRPDAEEETPSVPGPAPRKDRRPSFDIPCMTIEQCAAVYRKWFGPTFDVQAGLAVWATAAAHDFPVSEATWLLVVAGSGGGKTEAIMPLVECGATAASTIASEGALLSATSKKDAAADASGGLLRQIGDEGILLIKDVTTILSMSGDSRAAVLAALREVYDGSWTRQVGTDGGRALTWAGKITVVGGVTTSWDRAHAVISSMGDRFMLVRMDTSEREGRLAAARSAARGFGKETSMREELADAVAELLAGATPFEELAELSDGALDKLIDAADLVSLARTAAMTAFNGDVEGVHAPEMATRLLKQAQNMALGAISLGATEEQAVELALRCLRDSLPPNRLKILQDLAQHPESTTGSVVTRTGVPRTTIDRELIALGALGVLVQGERESKYGTAWTWELAAHMDPAVLGASGEQPKPKPKVRAGVGQEVPPGYGQDEAAPAEQQVTPGPIVAVEPETEPELCPELPGEVDELADEPTPIAVCYVPPLNPDGTENVDDF